MLKKIKRPSIIAEFNAWYNSQFCEDGNEHSDDDVLAPYMMTPKEYDRYLTGRK